MSLRTAIRYSGPGRPDGETHTLITIDPAQHASGIAIATVDPSATIPAKRLLLLRVATVRTIEGTTAAMVGALNAACLRHPTGPGDTNFGGGFPFPRYVIERPQRYLDQTAKNRGVDAIEEVIEGFIKRRGLAAPDRKRTVTYFTPATWKGNVPKDVHHARLRRWLEVHELTAQVEATMAPDATHDAWDALGLLLYSLNLVGRGGL